MKLLGTLQAADVESRILRYRLLPFDGSVGQTNLGRITASKGVLTLPKPEDFVLNLEHDSKRPVGVGHEITETDEALLLAVRILETSAGNDLLVEAREKVRTGVSVEIDAPVVRGGKLLGGYLSGAGACTEPAWDGARLVASKTDAPDEGETEEDEEDNEDDPATTVAVGANEEEEGDPVPENENEETGTVATAPKLAASRAKLSKKIGAQDAFQLLAALRSGDQTAMAALEPAGKLFGALALVTEANGAAGGQAQWLGEIWSGRTFQRRIIPLLGSGTLTSMKVAGFKWSQKPEVAKFAGPPAEIHSAPVSLVPFSDDAQRWAGGNRIDRKFVDFNDVPMISAYLQALNDSYAEETDEDALAVIVAAATAVTAGTVPTDVPAGLVAIVDGALAVMEVGQPTFAIVPPAQWRDILLSKSIDALAYITSSLSLEEGSLNGFKIMPHPSVDDVIVGTSQAAVHYELPGSPLRVNAQAVAVGAIDEAVFGYDLTVVTDARGLAKVS
jgi:hypothetical protein